MIPIEFSFLIMVVAAKHGLLAAVFLTGWVLAGIGCRWLAVTLAGAYFVAASVLDIYQSL